MLKNESAAYVLNTVSGTGILTWDYSVEMAHAHRQAVGQRVRYYGSVVLFHRSQRRALFTRVRSHDDKHLKVKN